MVKDPAGAIKDTAAIWLADNYPGAAAVLHVPDDYQPSDSTPVVLVADDGGPTIDAGAWVLGRAIQNPTIRLTALTEGRTAARAIVGELSSWICSNRPADVTQIQNVSSILEARDRDTGAYMASVLMPILVKP
jgi:hypothetical protein